MFQSIWYVGGMRVLCACVCVSVDNTLLTQLNWTTEITPEDVCVAACFFLVFF